MWGPLFKNYEELQNKTSEPLSQVHGPSEPRDLATVQVENTSQVLFAKSLQSCSTLCNPMDCSLQGSSVHGILQARMLEMDAMPSSRGSSQRGIKPVSLTSPALAGGLFITSTTRRPGILVI